MKYWLVLRIKSQMHQMAAANVRNQATEFYYPMTQLRRRGALVSEPLFPGYAFARPDGDQWVFLRSTRGVLDVMMSGFETPARIKPAEIELIRSREDPETRIIPVGQQVFAPGERLSVQAGAFAGLTGIFDGMAAKDRVYVLLSLCGRKVRTELPERNVDHAS